MPGRIRFMPLATGDPRLKGRAREVCNAGRIKWVFNTFETYIKQEATTHSGASPLERWLPGCKTNSTGRFRLMPPAMKIEISTAQSSIKYMVILANVLHVPFKRSQRKRFNLPRKRTLLSVSIYNV
jgi:hypothetical protein